MLKKIVPGSTIAVIAPAFSVNQDKLMAGINYLEGKGYRVKQAPSCNSQWGYFSIDDEQRAKEINESFADPEVSAIICARGGWGSLRLLDKLDYSMISNNPKALIGYSDITTLQLAIWKKCKVPSISGPMVAVEMASGIPPITEEHFWGQLKNDESEYSVNLSDFKNVDTIKEGSTQGTLLGGCLSLLSHQLGTPFMPQIENCILFLEDIGEDVYKIDRYLAHLKQSGVFQKIKGLIIGQFLDCEDNSKPNFTIRELFSHYISKINGPVIFNFPYGHNPEKISLPVGVNARLDTFNKRFTVKNPFKA